MLDEVRVLRLLRGVTEEIAVLKAAAAADRARRADPLWLRGVKYTFVVAIEGCVDVAHHLCSAYGWGPPGDNADAMRLLGEHDVLPHALAGAMSQAVRFRNVLVHGYVAVRDATVLERLADLTDLESFVHEVALRVGALR